MSKDEKIIKFLELLIRGYLLLFRENPPGELEDTNLSWLLGDYNDFIVDLLGVSDEEFENMSDKAYDAAKNIYRDYEYRKKAE